MVVLKQDETYPSITDGFIKDLNFSMDQVQDALGDPTMAEPFNDILSRWVINFKGEYFYLYAWKDPDNFKILGRYSKANVSLIDQAVEYIELQIKENDLNREINELLDARDKAKDHDTIEGLGRCLASAFRERAEVWSRMQEILLI